MRREFPDKVKLAAWLRCAGLCENALCQAKLRPGKFRYDHRIPDHLGGEPTLENCQVICIECDKDKTGRDQGDIAKAHRRERKNLGIRRRPSRPLPGTRASGIRRRMDGTVERW